MCTKSSEQPSVQAFTISFREAATKIMDFNLIFAIYFYFLVRCYSVSLLTHTVAFLFMTSKIQLCPQVVSYGEKRKARDYPCLITGPSAQNARLICTHDPYLFEIGLLSLNHAVLFFPNKGLLPTPSPQPCTVKAMKLDSISRLDRIDNRRRRCYSIFVEQLLLTVAQGLLRESLKRQYGMKFMIIRHLVFRGEATITLCMSRRSFAYFYETSYVIFLRMTLFCYLAILLFRMFQGMMDYKI